MGPVAAVRILHRRKIAAVAADLRPTMELELAAEHEKLAGGVEKAVEIGVVDEIVSPDQTRSALGAALAAALGASDAAAATTSRGPVGRSRGAHGNIPL
jgi:acetyl-CoA/propionyl-CoA carboxylase carboxyl transferase subunit